MNAPAPTPPARVAFIGSAGIPNRYGGFEAFLEHCAPEIARQGWSVVVTCDAALYQDKSPDFHGVRRIFIPCRANGASSILHDLLAFLSVIARVDCVVVLGVSGGAWFPFFRATSSLLGRRLLVNVDGVEWRRSKFSPLRRRILRAFDALAQRFAHGVIYDNPALVDFLIDGARQKSHCIAYPGDYVLRLPAQARQSRTALTICRIEPENNIEMIIEGVLRSTLVRCTIVGNWSHSEYGRSLRERFRHEAALALLDPIYDAEALAKLRESCDAYIHGHSVGGTNPSLVEMLFYDCRILCFDCSFNRSTAGSSAEYFADAEQLAARLDAPGADFRGDRDQRRAQYTRQQIAAAYIALFRPGEGENRAS